MSLTKELVAQVESAALAYRDPLLERVVSLLNAEKERKVHSNAETLQAARLEIEATVYPEGLSPDALRRAAIMAARSPWLELSFERARTLLLESQGLVDRELNDLLPPPAHWAGLTVVEEPRQATLERGPYQVGDRVAFGRFEGTVLSVGDKLTVEFCNGGNAATVTLSPSLVRLAS